MATLAEIRAKLKAQDDRNSGTAVRTNADKTMYPFWDIKEGTDAVIRFLPDNDQSNTFFWVERIMINLPFAGIKGQTDTRQVEVKVPCMEMYGMVDPIIAETKPWWDDAELKDLARVYWKKRSYLFQGLVVRDGLNEKPEDKPENPIRRFIIGPQLFQIIRSSLLDPELDDSPTDYINGLDFKITKTTKGKHNDYSTSTWSRRTRPLGEDEYAAVEKNGLYNLRDFLPKKPSEIEQKVIKEMFEASVAGEAFDMERWGQYYKPSGSNDADALPPVPTSSAPVAKPSATVAPVVDSVVTDDIDFEDNVATSPVEVPTATTSQPSNRAADILASIRNRPAQ